MKITMYITDDLYKNIMSTGKSVPDFFVELADNYFFKGEKEEVKVEEVSEDIVELPTLGKKVVKKKPKNYKV